MSKCPECENRGINGDHLRGCIFHDDPTRRRVGWNLDPVFDHPNNPKAV